MKTYYTTNPDNSIAASSDSKFAWNCLETEHQIVRGYDGKLYFADDAPKKPEELIRQERVAEFEARVEQHLDEFAQKRGWKNIDRAAWQTGQYKDDANVAQAAYDAAWKAAFVLTPSVENGTYTIEQAMQHLPSLPPWPDARDQRQKPEIRAASVCPPNIKLLQANLTADKFDMVKK